MSTEKTNPLLTCLHWLQAIWKRTDAKSLKPGVHVWVKPSLYSPLPGEHGVIVAIFKDDPYGPVLVRFDNGLRFRYKTSELSVDILTERRGGGGSRHADPGVVRVGGNGAVERGRAL